MKTLMFQLTAARRRLVSEAKDGVYLPKFQLTAARRRLAVENVPVAASKIVSTHSRPKAAGPLCNNILFR